MGAVLALSFIAWCGLRRVMPKVAEACPPVMFARVLLALGERAKCCAGNSEAQRFWFPGMLSKLAAAA